jgi:RNA-directed DNA polymerase
MKVRYRKGLANRPGPESCGGVREGVIEALTGERAGQPLSREIRQSGAPTLLSEAEGHTDEGAMREPSKGSTRSETLSMRRSFLYRNWEISSVPVEPAMLAERRAGRGRPMAASPAPTLTRSRMLA